MLRAVLSAAISAAVAAIPVATADASPVNCLLFDDSGICILTAEGGTAETAPVEETSDAAPSAPRVCRNGDDRVVDCTGPLGWWSSQYQCYLRLATHVPPDSPAWQGNTDGDVFVCTASVGGRSLMVWLPPGEGPPAAADPAVLAVSVSESLPLATAQVHTAPAPPHISYVNLETWLWVPAEQWAPVSQSATAGATTVTATAAPVRVEWEMGDGSPVHSCYSGGRAWVVGMTDAEETDCLYVYEQTSAGEPDDAFVISARIVYEVSWVCSGACSQVAGTLPEVVAPAGSGVLQVGQRQTVIVRD